MNNLSFYGSISNHRYVEVCGGLNIFITRNINYRKTEMYLLYFCSFDLLVHHFEKTSSKVGNVQGPMKAIIHASLLKLQT